MTLYSSPRRGLQAPNGDDSRANGDNVMRALVNALDRDVDYDSGPIASRPVSTPGTPGRAGRFYRSTDETPQVLYFDYGTGWEDLVRGNDTRLLTAALTAALAGTSGTPGSANHFVTDSDPRLPTAGEKTALASLAATIRGRVNASGSIAAGAGFTVSHPSTGVYVVTFATAFAAVPAVIAQAVAGSYTSVTAQLQPGATASVFTIHTRHTPDSGQYDDAFNFIAMAV